LTTINKYIGIAFIFTGLNAVCGLIGIIVSIYPIFASIYLPMQMIILGAIFDFLDGKIAKKSPVEFNLGIYLDSLGDIISFAILPGIMLLNAPLFGVELKELSLIFQLGIAGFYTLCGWARLIRFSFQPTFNYFEGFPSPAAALLVGTCAILSQFPEMHWLFWPNGVILSIIAILTGVNMVNMIKYPTPKRQMRSDTIFIIIAGVIVLIFFFLPALLSLIGILVISIVYTILGPYYFSTTEKTKLSHLS